MKIIIIIILSILAIIPVPIFAHILKYKNYRKNMSWNRYMLEFIGILASYMIIEFTLLETIRMIMEVM